MAASSRSPSVWIHAREGMFYPRVRGERVLHLDDITVMRMWEAVLRAEARRFEDKPLRRLVAEELAFESEIRFPLEEEEEPGHFSPVVTRISGMQCPGDPGECLVALVMGALGRREGFHDIGVVGCRWRPNGTCEVVLGPREAAGKMTSKAEGRPPHPG